MARDNFKRSTITKLAYRVDNTCSNPECRKITQAPSAKAQGTTKVGEAAHICAASPGGARYSSEMKTEERVAYDNGIWLCSICATLIDREPELYSIELLKRWKHDAEAKARHLLGKRRVDERDVASQVQSMLIGVPTSRTLSTITNAHTAVAQSLEALDPRFSVLTSHAERGVHVELTPREQVSLKVIVDTAATPDWASQLQTLVEHGRGFKTPTRHMRIEGSSLLEHIRRESAFVDGHMIFEPVGKEIRLQWALLDSQTKTEIFLQDLAGTVVVGTKSGVMNFIGYEGLLKVSIRTILEGGVLTPTFSVTLDTQSWVDCDLRTLPHLQSLNQLFSNLRRGWVIKISVVRDNEHLEIGKLELSRENQDVLEMAHFLEYTTAARRLSTKLNKSIKFPKGGVITGEESRALSNALGWLDRADGPKRKRLQQGTINVKISVGDPIAVEKTIKNQMPQAIVYRGSFPPLIVFGQSVEIPAIECVIRNVVARTSLNISGISLGDKLDLIYEQTKSTTISVRLLP